MNSSAPKTGSAFKLDNRLRTIAVRLLQIALGKSSLTLLDQVVFSGTNFITTVLLGRWAGPESLGVYTLVFAVMIITLTVHESLVCLPYAIEFRKIPKRAQKAYAGSTLIQSSLLAMIATPILMFSGLIAWLTPIAGTSVGSAICVFALVSPLVVIRDFARRFSLAHLRPHIAVIIDGTVSVIQILCLAFLAFFGWLSAWTAIAVVGLGGGVVAVAWLIVSRPQFEFRRRRYRHDARRNWKLGQWVFLSQVCTVITAYSPYWLIAAILGTSETGVFVGCVAIVLLSNPFILGVHNYLSPKISYGLAQQGSREIGRVVTESTLFLALVMAVVCLAIGLFGDQFTTAVYGQQYGGNNLTTFVYALSTLSSSLGMPADRALWAKNHPDVSFYAGLVGLVVAVAAASVAIPPWGIFGGAFGLMIGNLSATLLRWFAFVYLGIARKPIQN